MKNLFLLLLIVVLAGLGYQYREKISGYFGRPAPGEEAAQETRDATDKKSTPHPATDARAAAIRAYPALGQKESALNRTFLMLYNQAQQSEPDLLTQPDWPMILAKRAAASLVPATAAAPRTPSATPWQHAGSALDRKPGKAKGGALDQRPGRPPAQ